MAANPADPTAFAAFAERLADAARGETLPRFRAGLGAETKSSSAFDPVTDADREAERALRAMIRAEFPGHGLIGEEFGSENAGAQWRWVIDPVDGTRAFICGSPSWTTLIALERHGRAALGIIDQPFTDERWIAFGGTTAYALRGRRKACRTSGVADLSVARIATTDPTPNGFTAAEADAFAALAGETRLARFGLDAYAYGLLALGEIDLVVEAGLKRHDFAALLPVVEGAGGVITGWRGEPPGEDERGRIVAAATPALHARALERLRDV